MVVGAGLEVLDEPTSPANMEFRRCLTSAFCFIEGKSDGRNDAKRLPYDSRKIGWQVYGSMALLMARAKE